MEGLVFSIVRTSLHDGPGIRTVIYFKGCTLHCAWCHNPEGIAAHPEILSYPDRCIGCERCVSVCPEHIRGGFRLPACCRCGQCAQACPGEALVNCGERYTVNSLMKIIRKDKVYYDRSGGGVTFSGGECLMQSEFVADLAKACRDEGIHTACETALHVSQTSVSALIEHINLFYVDLKHMDPEVHKRWTGADNRRILENIRFLAKEHPNVIVRIPLIPGVNDDTENLSASARFIAECGRGIQALELLRYNELASSKYASVGYNDAQFAGWKPQSDTEMENKRALMRELLPPQVSVL